MRVWLDDNRPAPPGWMWTRTVDQTLRRIAQGGVTEVSLDYDLDATDPGKTGMDVMQALLEAAAAGFATPVIHFHTANPMGASRFALAWRGLEAQHGLPWMPHLSTV